MFCFYILAPEVTINGDIYVQYKTGCQLYPETELTEPYMMIIPKEMIVFLKISILVLVAIVKSK
jgi:hypothetical protein